MFAARLRMALIMLLREVDTRRPKGFPCRLYFLGRQCHVIFFPVTRHGPRLQLRRWSENNVRAQPIHPSCWQQSNRGTGRRRKLSRLVNSLHQLLDEHWTMIFKEAYCRFQARCRFSWPEKEWRARLKVPRTTTTTGRR